MYNNLKKMSFISGKFMIWFSFNQIFIKIVFLLIKQNYYIYIDTKSETKISISLNQIP